jgi:osmotically-inducible protein OsmY
MTKRLLLAAFAAVAGVSTLLAGCVPLIVGGAVAGTALVATDRRSVGAQADDEAIELKIANNIGTGYGDRVHVNVTSYNGIVLLTGEVPTQDLVGTMAEIARTTAKVRRVHNEIVFGPVSDVGARSNDTYITSKVKARMVEANKFPPNAVKVVTERGVVYLMGIVSKAEGTTAGDIAATTDGCSSGTRPRLSPVSR